MNKQKKNIITTREGIEVEYRDVNLGLPKPLLTRKPKTKEPFVRVKR